jgi:hypothetical protein
MERLTGTFEMVSEGEKKRYELYVDRGRLMERRVAPGAKPFALSHVGAGTFANPDWGELRLVTSQGADRVRTIVETWGGFFGDVAYRVEEP